MLCFLFLLLLSFPDNGPLCTTPQYHYTISEAASPGTHLLQVTASDPDLTSQPQYYLTGEGAGMFKLDINTGHLSTAKTLDRETFPEYSLQATVRDGDRPDWECSCEVKIEVTDVNDNAPVFSMSSYSINVPENSPENLLLLKVHASDPDQGEFTHGFISISNYTRNK